MENHIHLLYSNHLKYSNNIINDTNNTINNTNNTINNKNNHSNNINNSIYTLNNINNTLNTLKIHIFSYFQTNFWYFMKLIYPKYLCFDYGYLCIPIIYDLFDYRFVISWILCVLKSFFIKFMYFY